MNQGMLNIIYILVGIVCIYLLKKLTENKEGFYGANKFGRVWFGSERRFNGPTWRQPYSFYNTYPRWFYNNYIEPAYSLDPVYIVTNSNSKCKTNCFDKYKDIDNDNEIDKEEIEKIKECLKKC